MNINFPRDIKNNYIMTFSENITNDKWGVTLICIDNKRHAQIAIQKINEFGERENQVIEFGGPNIFRGTCSADAPRTDGLGFWGIHSNIGRVIIRNFDAIKCTRRTVTYLCDANLVQNMIQSAEEEKDYLGNPKAFNICGCPSKLAPDVATHRIHSPFLKLLYHVEGHKTLMKIYDFAKKHEEDLDTEGMLDNEKYNPFSRNGINKFKIGENHQRGLIETIDYGIEKIKIAYSRMRAIHFLDKSRNILEIEEDKEVFKEQFLVSEEECQEILGKIAWYVENLETNPHSAARRFMRSVLTNIEEIEMRPHNCFTWAREKLQMVGIDLPVTDKESFISNTWIYAKNLDPWENRIIDLSSPSEERKVDIAIESTNSSEEDSESIPKNKKFKD